MKKNSEKTAKRTTFGTGVFFVLLFALWSNVYGQKVEVDQSFVDDAAKAFAEVVELRKTVDQFLIERKTNEFERASANALIKSLNEIISLKDRKELALNELIATYERIMRLQSEIIDKLEKALNKPKSAFAKFLNYAKQVLTLAAGVLIGRGL